MTCINKDCHYMDETYSLNCSKEEGKAFTFCDFKTVELPENYTLDRLVENAIRNATPDEAGEADRWVAVRDTFATGATVAVMLCKAYGLDPFEKVHGVSCIACNPQLED